MQYDALKKMVTGSSAGDWAMLGEGPLYLDRFTELTSEGQHWLEVGGHHYLAVYRTDVNLRLAWGLELEDRLEFEGWTWPDSSISRFAVDAFWQGALVTRWTLLLVDGARSYLPDPQRGSDGTGWTAKADEVGLARLLQELVRRPEGQFNRYMEGAGIVIAPDE